MKKLILLAALTFATSAFARGDKRTFKVSVTGQTAQTAYDNAVDLIDAIEDAGPTRADFYALGLPRIHAEECSTTSGERDNARPSRPFLDRDAHITGQITYGVNPRTGVAAWTAKVFVSCEK